MSVDDFLLFVGFGIVGIGTLALTLLIEPATFSVPDAIQERSLPVRLAVYTIQPTIVLVLAVAGGLLVASSVPFQSHLVADEGTLGALTSELRPALLVGISVGTVILVIELALSGIPEPVGVLETDQSLTVLLFSLPARILYGGVTEELIARLGVMSVVAYGLWWVVRTQGVEFTPTLIWIAVVVAGVAFALLHLPTAGATVSGGITIPVIAWVLLANTAAGIAYGWLFWQYSLEAAMIAHASTHIIWVTLSGILIVS